MNNLSSKIIFIGKIFISLGAIASSIIAIVSEINYLTKLEIDKPS